MRSAFQRLASLSLLALVALQSQDIHAQLTDDQKLSDVLAQGIQHKNPPWERYPTTLPSAFVDAADFMFDHGLADPRGGDYRHIGVTFKNSMRDEEEQVRTRGWVFTNGETGLQYAVCWDGLVYKVDWVAGHVRVRDETVYANPLLPFKTKQDQPYGNGYPVFTTRSPVAAALFYRLGVDDGAKKLLNKPGAHSAMSYWQGLSTPVMTRLYHRGVASFLAGDDKAALHDLDAASKIGLDLEEILLMFHEAERQHFYPFRRMNDLKLLRDEIEDRILNPRIIEIDYEKLKALPRKDRMRQMIINLQETWTEDTWGPNEYRLTEGFDFEIVLGRQTELATDPAQLWEYQQALTWALTAEGEDSVPDLLDIAREGKYAARYVSRYGGGNGPPSGYMLYRSIPFGSAMAAGMAQNYIRPTYTADLSPGGSVYDQWEVYWDRYKSTTAPQRYLQILGEDDRSVDAWVDAMHQLTMAHRSRDGEYRIAWRDFLTDEVAESIFATMYPRLEASIEDGSIEFSQMMTLAWAAYRLDPQKAKRALAAPVEDLVARREELRYYTTVGHSDSTVHEITVLRMQIGEPNAVSDYIKVFGTFARNHGPGPGRIDPTSFHLPVVMFPDTPEFKSFLADSFELFRDSIRQNKSFLRGYASDIAPFLVSQELRPAIAEMLEDATVSGKVTVETVRGSDTPDSNGLFSIKVRQHNGGRDTGNNIRVPKEDLRYIGTDHELRTMDWVARSLSKANFGPPFELFWETEKRDKVIKEYQKLVMTAEIDFTNILGYSYSEWWMSDKPVFLRKRPARPTFPSWPRKGS